MTDSFHFMTDEIHLMTEPTVHTIDSDPRAEKKFLVFAITAALLPASESSSSVKAKTASRQAANGSPTLTAT